MCHRQDLPVACIAQLGSNFWPHGLGICRMHAGWSGLTGSWLQQAADLQLLPTAINSACVPALTPMAVLW